MQIKYVPFLYSNSHIREEIIDSFKNFYDRKSYILGEELKAFEAEFADLCKSEHAIGVGNGHDALFIALKCLGIKPGDEVIVPAYTFVATALATKNTGAKLVLADVDAKSYNISSDQAEQKITPYTKAIVPVHLFGNPCDMEIIMKLGQKYDISIVEDNAQAHGATFKNKPTGGFGIINITSFYPTKNLGALGDGGMITTNDDQLAKKARQFRNYGNIDGENFEDKGINSRLDEIQATFLRVKLKYLHQWNEERISIAGKYNTLLSKIEQVYLPTSLPDAKHVFHIFPIRTEKRNALKSFLASKGIDTIVHYPNPIHMLTPFLSDKYPKGSLPVAEMICETELSLPIYPGMKDIEIEYVCDSIRQFFDKNQS